MTCRPTVAAVCPASTESRLPPKRERGGVLHAGVHLCMGNDGSRNDSCQAAPVIHEGHKSSADTPASSPPLFVLAALRENVLRAQASVVLPGHVIMPPQRQR
ncbi:hypothetical protein ABPG77_002926 [Micractinium sp. CCAP 211/92]